MFLLRMSACVALVIGGLSFGVPLEYAIILVVHGALPNSVGFLNFLNQVLEVVLRTVKCSCCLEKDKSKFFLTMILFCLQ
jgi:hypothetical protein